MAYIYIPRGTKYPDTMQKYQSNIFILIISTIHIIIYRHVYINHNTVMIKYTCMNTMSSFHNSEFIWYVIRSCLSFFFLFKKSLTKDNQMLFRLIIHTHLIGKVLAFWVSLCVIIIIMPHAQMVHRFFYYYYSSKVRRRRTHVPFFSLIVVLYKCYLIIP